jgi:transglutaminase-like putative cysteine protease
VGRAERNDLSAILVVEGPDMLQFDAWSDPSALLDAAPGRNDLAVPANLAGALGRAADEAGLHGQAPDEIARRLKRFFDERFAYSLNLTRAGGRARTLGDFLLTDRRGHCEYFATATVLLLRHVGVPARYATGYAVQEYSSLERQHVVRARHAHAWALAWLDGRWQELDTTPARWAQEESEQASPLQPLYDLASLLNYLFARWRATPEDTNQRDVSLWLWLTLPLALFLGWQIYRRQRMRVAGTRRESGARSDPRVTALLATLAHRGYARPSAAPLQTWIARLPLPDPQLREALRRFVRDYYRLRFDPGRDDASLDRSLSQQAQALQRMLRT